MRQLPFNENLELIHSKLTLEMPIMSLPPERFREIGLFNELRTDSSNQSQESGSDGSAGRTV